LLERTGPDTYRRIKNSTASTDRIGNLLPLHRRRICIEHHENNAPWPVYQRKEYIIRIRWPSGCKGHKIVTVDVLNGYIRDYEDHLNHGTSQCFHSAVIMKEGSFVTAITTMPDYIPDNAAPSHAAIGIAVRRCDDSVTLTAWPCDGPGEFESEVLRMRPRRTHISEKTDTISLPATSDRMMEIRLRPKGIAGYDNAQWATLGLPIFDISFHIMPPGWRG
jgi:hypothetical protein